MVLDPLEARVQGLADPAGRDPPGGVGAAVDRAVHLQGTPSADGLANARVLADHLRDGGYDLILFGKVAVDDYGQQTGAMVAELLGRPCATAITSLVIEGGTAKVTREVEGGVESAHCSLPAVFTCDKGLNTPRLPGRTISTFTSSRDSLNAVKPALMAASTVFPRNSPLFSSVYPSRLLAMRAAPSSRRA